MRNLALAVLALTLSGPAFAAEQAPRSVDFDLAQFAAARGNERTHCAQTVKRSIEVERARCGPAPECAQLREDERSIADNIIFTGGDLPEGREAEAIRLLAASGCSGILFLDTTRIVERTRLCPQPDDCIEIRSAEQDYRVGPPAEASGSAFVNDLQSRAEALLGFDVTDHTRCGLSTIRTRRWRPNGRSGQVNYSEKEAAFLGCYYRVRL